MKHLIILFVLIATTVFAQIEQRPDQMEQLLWWDLYTTATANGAGGAAIVLSDSIADDDITVGTGDTVYARLFISGTHLVKAMDIVLQYGCNQNYRPNSFYATNLTLNNVLIDSLSLDMVTTATGLIQQVNNPTSKRLMVYYLNSGTIDLNTKSIIILTFIVSATAVGQQILALPLPEIIDPNGYTLRYWTEVYNAKSKPFSTWVHNATIKVE